MITITDEEKYNYTVELQNGYISIGDGQIFLDKAMAEQLIPILRLYVATGKLSYFPDYLAKHLGQQPSLTSAEKRVILYDCVMRGGHLPEE